MDPLDYAQKIGDLHTDYRKKITDQRKIHKQETSATEERADKRFKTQQDAYIRDRREVEKSSARELDNIRSHTDDLLRLKQKNYDTALEARTGKFEKSFQDIAKRFDKRSTAASEAYRSSLGNIQHVHEATMRTKKNDMEEKNDNIRKTYDNATERLQDFTEKSLQRMKDRQIKYKESYMSKKQKQIEDLNRQQSKHLMDIHEKYDYKLKELKESQAQRVKSLKEQMDEKTKIKKKKDDDTIRAITAKYDDLFKDFQDTSRINTAKQQVRHKDQIARLVDHHEDQLDFQKTKYYEASTGGGEVETLHDMSDRERDDSDRRIENLKEEIRDRDLRYLDHNEQTVKKFTQDLRERNKLHRDDIEEVKGEYRKLSWELNDEFRKDKKNIQDSYRQKIAGDQRQFSTTLTAERNRNNNGMRRLKKDFGEALHVMSEKNLTAISNLQEESADEKRTIIESAKENLHATSKELRDDFEIDKSLLLKSQEERDIQHRNKLISTQQRYEGKLSALKKKLGKLIRLQLRTHEELRDSERKKAKNMLKMAKKETDVALWNQRDRYNKSMDKIKTKNDQALSNLTNYYEDQILQMTIDHNREVREKLDSSISKYQQYVQSSEVEKSQMRRSFEAQMDDMRAKFQSYKNSRAKHA